MPPPPAAAAARRNGPRSEAEQRAAPQDVRASCYTKYQNIFYQNHYLTKIKKFEISRRNTEAGSRAAAADGVPALPPRPPEGARRPAPQHAALRGAAPMVAADDGDAGEGDCLFGDRTVSCLGLCRVRTCVLAQLVGVAAVLGAMGLVLALAWA